MSGYTINTATCQVTRDDDGVVVAPAQSPDAPDFAAYIAWVEAGGEPAVVNIPVLTAVDYTDAMQAHLDAQAQACGYDGILSAASYASSSSPKFGPEGRAFADWRDAVWTYGYTLLAEVQAGLAAPPTIDELIAGLPALTLPD